MNFSDSEKLETILESENFEKVDEIYSSKIAIINSCAVRKSSEDRAVNLTKDLRKKNKDQIIIFTGCVEENFRSKDLAKMMPDVNVFLPISEMSELPEILRRVDENSQEFIPKIRNSVNYFSISPKLSSKFKAFVPIMTGCDKFCTYCVVPITRGAEESRPAREIIDEIKILIKKGVKEITLLGQNVNSYGTRSGRKSLSFQEIYKKGFWAENENSKTKIQNFENNENFHPFSQLVKQILEEIDEFFWLKFFSPHPNDFHKNLIEVAKNDERIARSFHIPLQSGSNKVLELMKRPHSADDVLNKILEIKKEIPDITFTTDIIVGFPNETEEDFQKTLKIVEKIGFVNIFTGKFSKRFRTPAWNFEETCDNTEKRRRDFVLNQLLESITLKHSESLVGKEVLCLVEEKLQDLENNQNQIFIGRLDSGKSVEFSIQSSQNKNLQIGDFVKVKILKAGMWRVWGEV